MPINNFNQDQLTLTYEYDQILSNGNIIHLATILNGDFPVQEIPTQGYFCNAPNMNRTSSVVNLTPFINEAGSIANSDVVYVLPGVFVAPQNKEYYNTDEYLLKEELVKNNIKFIWGSYEDGGLFVFKDSANGNKPTFYLLNGWFSRNDITEDDYIGALLIFGGSYGPEYDFSKVFFYIDGVKTFNDLYQYQKFIHMYIGGNNCTVNIANWHWNLLVQPTPYYQLEVIGRSFDTVGEILTQWDSILIDDVTWEDPHSIYNFNGLTADSFLFDNISDFSLLDWISGSPTGGGEIDDQENPYAGGGFSGGGGGGTSLDNNVDTNTTDDDKATKITIDAVTSGICKVYNPTASELNDFNQFLYSGITDSIEKTLKKLTSDPLQYIISLGMVHFTPPATITSPIMMGSIDSGVSALRINRQYTSLDFGSIVFNNEFKSFLDYNPYSKISIYLPYIGIRELNMDECRGSRISLVYNIDMITGSCVAYVHISRLARSSADCSINHTMYTFEGNCLTQIPMFATDNRGAIQSLLSLAGAGVSLATGNIAGAVTGLVNGVTTQKISVGRAGTLSSNYGFISRQEPCIIAERPIVNIPINFGAFEGWTSNIRQKIGSLKGYTEIDSNTLWTDNMTCTQEEADEIRDLFNSGVYL